MDLKARHITYQGEHPIFCWGQNYMGSLHAYLGVALISLVGSSAFSVRLGTLLIFALYLVCLYFLVRLLYTPAYVLFIIALLRLGSDRMLGMPLAANGGYAETMFFGAAIFLLASCLGITAPHQGLGESRSWLLAYVGLGVTIDLALWSDQFILPAIFTAGVFLLLCCALRSNRHASNTIPKLLCMSLKETNKLWISIHICTMLSLRRHSSISAPKYAWKKRWRNRKTADQRARSGMLNEVHVVAFPQGDYRFAVLL